ncbi:MAG: FHA domain-containing protein [Deltaproteobacteria bacterium]|nr:FHA domain-containing protein [Deltaproteobacteria bacterium]
MRIFLKDLQTGKDFIVTEPGAIIGRDVGHCSIAIAEKSISNIHAKVSAMNGRWLIEDQGSSNGTFMAGKRLSQACELRENDEFALFRYRFKVMKIENETGEVTKFDTGAATQMLAIASNTPFAVPESQNNGALASSRSLPNPTKYNANINDVDLNHRSGDNHRVSNGTFIENIKQGFAYYLVAIVRLVRRPIVTTNAITTAPPLPAMLPIELAAFAAPAFFLGSLATAVATILVSVISHGAVVSSITSSLISIAISSVVGIVGGYLLHPILRWFVRILKGNSDELTRTNYGVAVFTATALTTILGACGILISLIPLPFINVVPIILSLLGSLLILYIAYVWFKFFGVIRVIPIVFLILMGLSVVSSARTIFYVIKGNASTNIAATTEQTLSSGTTNVVTVSNDELSNNANNDEGRLSRAFNSIKIKVHGLFGSNSNKETNINTEKLIPVKVLSDSTPNSNNSTNSVNVSGTSAFVTKSTLPNNIDKKRYDNAMTINPDSNVIEQSTNYTEYKRKLNAIEGALAADPTLLIRAIGVRPLYKKLHQQIKRIEGKRPQKTKKKNSDEDLYQERLRQAQLYEATYKIVNELYIKAVANPVFNVRNKNIRKKPKGSKH